MNITQEILQVIESYEDSLNACAGSPVILGSSFQELAEMVSAFPEVKNSKEEVLSMYLNQAKRFAACGANFSDERSGVLRKNPKTGWVYLVDLLSI